MSETTIQTAPVAHAQGRFPAVRPRRLRLTASLRQMVRETRLSPDDFIYPLFVTHGENVARPIASMPGICQLSVDRAVRQAEAAHRLGIPAVLLFGIPATKDPVGLENFSPDGIVQRAIRAIKEAVPGLTVVTDVCLCEYTDHGHCGLLNVDAAEAHRDGPARPEPALPEGYVLNDETLEILQRVALSHAEAGADVVAPSGMMDGMVAAIRAALDGHGFAHVPIMSYSVKYASAFYGPFREAAGGAPRFGDRSTHQMDPANAREALREAALDVQEGADFLMVKPALAYLDVLHRLRNTHPDLPLVAYNVSGEYAMVKAAAARGWLDEQRTVLEILTGLKRAGADLIITYHALDAARWLRKTYDSHEENG
ncbi:porphobilinogen synthase [Rhodocaloribacter litoris]|uniref:porphobilinogen synthase n=1 Tax=Rhodocaloribacter litoris TaxID=2558931 RepID=UPI00141F6BF8|nr:porphobilinogen synthase [Rhodocaloribacter litoris]QXD15684.1 porphobilinogen synthase [Rhodocaloribacter litoris]GIV61619.1 MAG: delta-aminolevulinic acid dehydratase [Rhodothermaceae bacterium]